MNFLQKREAIYHYERIINIENIETFLQNLYQFDWSSIQPLDRIKNNFESNQYI